MLPMSKAPDIREEKDRVHGGRELLIDKIFAREKINLDVFESSLPAYAGDNSLTWSKVNGITDLRELVLRRAAQSVSKGTVIIIPQDYSWGRLQITEDVFNELLRSAKVSTAFSKIILSYGIKHHEDERAFYGFHHCERQEWSECSSRLSIKQSREDQPHEFCYNVPHMAKHGRSLADPWSLRQSAIYVQQGSRPSHSFCIVVNPKDQCGSQLAALVEDDPSCCHLSLHVTFLQYLAEGWAEYIEHLCDQLHQHDNEVQYSKIDEQAGQSGYALSHCNLQDLHTLQSKIERARYCVQSCVKVGQHCQSRTNNNPQGGFLSSLTSCYEHSNIMLSYITCMINHTDRLQYLQVRLSNIQGLLSSILIHRNSLLLQTSNRSSASNLAALLEITVQSKAQQDILTSLLGNAQADSTLLKVLSMVATICLPASLIATVFSSNLIQSVSMPTPPSSATVDTGENTGKERMILSTQFWIYAAITVPMMLITLLWILALDRRAHQKAKKGMMRYKKGGLQ